MTTNELILQKLEHCETRLDNSIAILKELEGSVHYWSEYDVPIGIVDRITTFLDKEDEYESRGL